MLSGLREGYLANDKLNIKLFRSWICIVDYIAVHTPMFDMDTFKVECPTVWSTQRQIRPFLHMY